jgi:hypothetical protein
MKQYELQINKDIGIDSVPPYKKRIWGHIRFSFYYILSVNFFIVLFAPSLIQTTRNIVLFLTIFFFIPLTIYVIPKIKRGSIFIFRISTSDKIMIVDFFDKEIEKSISIELKIAKVEMNVIPMSSNRYTLDIFSNEKRVLRQFDTKGWDCRKMINVIETFCGIGDPVRKELPNIRYYCGITD